MLARTSNVYPFPASFTFHEFFAGGGMARAGLGPRWQCLFANDMSPQKASAYAINWGADHLKVADIFQLTPCDVPGSVDLSWGSFPCQDLSLAGAGAGLEGESSGAFWGYWKLVQALRSEGRAPKLVVLENVYGSLTSHNGQDFQKIIEAVVQGGYRVGALVMDAIRFLPHSRPRVFFIAVEQSTVVPTDIVAAEPNPNWHPLTLIHAQQMLPEKLQEAWLWWNPGVPDCQVLPLTELIEDDPQGVKWHTASETRKLLSMMTKLHREKIADAQKSGKRSVGGVYKRTRKGVQRAEVRFDGVMGCLRTPSGGSSRQIVLLVEGARIRSRLLSPREAARLMGLPDSYRLPIKYNEAYHLAGDGVAVPVVAHLARHLFEPILLSQGVPALQVEAA